MKKIFLFLFLNVGATYAIAQDSTINLSNKIISQPAFDTATMAKVYVIRSTGYVGSAVNFRLLVDDVLLCKIKNNRYSILYVKVGTHSFTATSWDKPDPKNKLPLTMAVEAGKEYYLSMRIKPRFATTEFYLEEITLNSAAPQLKKYKQDDCE